MMSMTRVGVWFHWTDRSASLLLSVVYDLMIRMLNHVGGRIWLWRSSWVLLDLLWKGLIPMPHPLMIKPLPHLIRISRIPLLIHWKIWLPLSLNLILSHHPSTHPIPSAPCSISLLREHLLVLLRIIPQVSPNITQQILILQPPILIQFQQKLNILAQIPFQISDDHWRV